MHGLSIRSGRNLKNFGDSIKSDETDPVEQKSILITLFHIIGQVLKLNADRITLNDSLVHDLGADSLAVHKILLAIMEQFECDGSLEDACQFEFVKDVVNFVEEKCSLEGRKLLRLSNEF